MEVKTKKETKLIIIIASVVAIPVLIFFGIIYYDLIDLALQPHKPVVFASVNGDEINYMVYAALLQKGIEEYSETEKKEIPENQINEMKEQIFDFLVEQSIEEQSVKNYNIEIEDKEVDYVMYKNPGSLPDNVKSVFTDSGSEFREDLYFQAINTDSPENNKFKENLKYAIKRQLETKKLFDMVTGDVKLTDEDFKNNSKYTEANVLLAAKQYSVYQKWKKEMKSKAVIVDNRKYFEDKIPQNNNK